MQTQEERLARIHEIIAGAPMTEAEIAEARWSAWREKPLSERVAIRILRGGWTLLLIIAVIVLGIVSVAGS